VAESPIEQELCGLVDIQQNAEESRQKFLKRLIGKIDKVPDADWEKLSTQAQKWHGDAIKAIDAGEDVPDFPDIEERPVASTRTRSSAAAEEEEAPRKKKGAGNGAATQKDPAPKKEAAKKDEPAPKKEAAPKKPSALTEIKKMILANPKIDPAGIAEGLTKKGLTASSSTIQTVRADMRHTLRVLVDAGKLEMTLD
jgi:hypothetical protein